jgi:hypothetical protein
MAPKKLPIKGKDVANKLIGKKNYPPLMLTFGKYKRICNNKAYWTMKDILETIVNSTQ